MNPVALQTALRHLFERHEVELDADEEWLVTDDDFPAIRATWYEGESGQPGRLDVDVVLSEERRIEQSFAGHGSGEAGWRDALERFAHSDLPVLLAACWYVTDDRTLDLAGWEIGVRSWDAFLGRFVVEGAAIEVPADAAAVIAKALQNETLAAQPHWLRLLLRRAADGELAVECLLDNEPWPAGDRALDSIAWPANAQPYSVRAFWMLDLRDY
jgi:hypothetical protein